MWEPRRLFVLFAASTFVFALAAHGQDDSPSLGDVARQSRLQKQQQENSAGKDGQSKDAASKSGAAHGPATPPPAPGVPELAPGKEAQEKGPQAADASAKDAPAPKSGKKVVITNDEIPEHIGPTRTATSPSQRPIVYYPQSGSGANQFRAEDWKSQILALKQNIANFQKQIDDMNSSIQYSGANCVSGCVQWNERQKQKQDQVEVMKGQLEQMQKRLEEVQEVCRKQGYGSSVYDP